MTTLRLSLLGDGVDTLGLVRDEEPRLQVTAELRHMREASQAVVAASDEARAEKAEARRTDLEKELRRIASIRSRTNRRRRTRLRHS
jgi:hypothetical protein